MTSPSTDNQKSQGPGLQRPIPMHVCGPRRDPFVTIHRAGVPVPRPMMTIAEDRLYASSPVGTRLTPCIRMAISRAKTVTAREKHP